MTDTQPIAPEDETDPSPVILRDAIMNAIRDASRSPAGIWIMADDVVLALIDTLASVIVKNPRLQTLRGKREYLDEINEALKEQVAAYLAAAPVEAKLNVLRESVG